MSQAERDASAKSLLAEAGYGPDNPLKFEMIYNTSESHKRIAVAMSQMWKQKLGVETTLANMEWKTFLEVPSQPGLRARPRCMVRGLQRSVDLP